MAASCVFTGASVTHLKVFLPALESFPRENRINLRFQLKIYLYQVFACATKQERRNENEQSSTW